MAYKCARTSAAAVANEFLQLGRGEPNVPPIDQMKLQKLLWYAYAWYLAQTSAVLFEENFEAWPWGPVVRNVYYQTASCGKEPIKSNIKTLVSTGDGILNARFDTPFLELDDLKAYVKAVWETHKAFTGIQLSNATHLPGEPWTIMNERYSDLGQKPTIPNELIEAIFKGKIAKNDSAQSAASAP